MKKNIGGYGAASVAFIVFLVIVAPWITFWFAYCGGWIAKMIMGRTLVNALNILVGYQRFNVDDLPIIAGALGWISGFFKVSGGAFKEK